MMCHLKNPLISGGLLLDAKRAGLLSIYSITMKTCLLTLLCVAVEFSASAQTNETDFVSIFDGKSLNS